MPRSAMAPSRARSRGTRTSIRRSPYSSTATSTRSSSRSRATATSGATCARDALCSSCSRRRSMTPMRSAWQPLAKHPADIDPAGPAGAFAEALASARHRERHDASSRTRHQWDDGSALVTFDVGVWHHAVHASWLPYANTWWTDAMGAPPRFATLQDGQETHYTQPNA